MPKARGNREGSIYKRKDGRWAAALTLSTGRRRTLYGRTRAEVDQKLLKRGLRMRKLARQPRRSYGLAIT